MRRSPIVLTATVAGMAGVLAFKPHAPELSVAAASSTSTSSSTDTSSASTDTSSGSIDTSSTSTDTSSGSTDSSTSGSSSSISGTYTGDSIATQYGNAQVKVTIKDGKITEVEALQLQANDPRSVQISNSAAPILRQSALDKQSGAIDAVSGATFTSASYEASLQSALDKAGFKAADGSVGSSEIPQATEGHGGGPGDWN